MRVGANPQKSEGLIELKTNHRVVVVTFIPELKGYYKSMFEVIKLCLSSLIKTIPDTTAITIVDNASCAEVVNYFLALYKDKKIDSLQLLSTNVGKIDALMGAARSAREAIITLTDCDVLFKTSWVEETINIFNSFKNIASVSPFPSRRGLHYYTFSIQLAVLKKQHKLYFEPIPENFEHHNFFLKSINWGIENDKNALWPILKSKGSRAIVGSNHQVITLRRDILFNNSPALPSLIKVGKGSERTYVDLAIDASGGFRVSTYNYLAHHMGNQIEPWMKEIEVNLSQTSKEVVLKLYPEIHYYKKPLFSYLLKKRITKFLFKRKVPKAYYSSNN